MSKKERMKYLRKEINNIVKGLSNESITSICNKEVLDYDIFDREKMENDLNDLFMVECLIEIKDNPSKNVNQIMDKIVNTFGINM